MQATTGNSTYPTLTTTLPNSLTPVATLGAEMKGLGGTFSPPFCLPSHGTLRVLSKDF